MEPLRPATEPTTAESRHSRRATAASFIGGTLEYYDFFIYSSASALIFGHLFFPAADSFVGTLAAFATFAVGYVVRPLSAGVMGHFGDRVGRRTMMVVTFGIMGVATILIGCLPTYATAGPLAPVLLIVLRAVQGISASGEWAGATLVSLEHSSAKRRGFNASWTSQGSAAGFLLATAAFSLVSTLSHQQLMAWGWRLPFLFSAVLVVIGLIIRRRVAEPETMREIKAQGPLRLPALRVLRDNPKEMVLIIASTAAPGMGVSLMTVFALAFGAGGLHIPPPVILNGLLVGNIAGLVAIPLFGALSDRVGRRPVAIAGSAIVPLGVLIMIEALRSRDASFITAALVLMNVCIGVPLGAAPALTAEQFEPNVRFSGTALSSQLGQVIGGLTPLVATALAGRHGAWWPVVALAAAGAVVSSIGVALMRETAPAKQDAVAEPQAADLAVALAQ
jgi:MFS family permease